MKNNYRGRSRSEPLEYCVNCPLGGVSCSKATISFPRFPETPKLHAPNGFQRRTPKNEKRENNDGDDEDTGETDITLAGYNHDIDHKTTRISLIAVTFLKLLTAILTSFLFLLPSMPVSAQDPDVGFGLCMEITFGIQPFSADYTLPFEQCLKKIIERQELNSGGDVYSNSSDIKEVLDERDEMKRLINIRKWLKENPLETAKMARYQLDIIIAGNTVFANVKNMETCEVLILEKVNVPDGITMDNIIQTASRLWQRLTRKGNVIEAYSSITKRLEEELTIKQGSASNKYYDYSLEPRYHPVSSDCLQSSIKIKIDGEEVTSYSPGDTIDITIVITESDKIPIRAFDPLAMITQSSFDVVILEASNSQGKQKQLHTDDKGQAFFRLITTEKSEGDIVVEITKDSKCENKKLLSKTIVIKSNKWEGHLRYDIKSEFNKGSINFTVEMDISFNALPKPKAVAVILWGEVFFKGSYTIIGYAYNINSEIILTYPTGRCIVKHYVPSKQLSMQIIGDKCPRNLVTEMDKSRINFPFKECSNCKVEEEKFSAILFADCEPEAESSCGDPFDGFAFAFLAFPISIFELKEGTYSGPYDYVTNLFQNASAKYTLELIKK